MSAAIKKLSVPPASEIFTALEGAYYSDSYQFYSQRPERKALQVFRYCGDYPSMGESSNGDKELRRICAGLKESGAFR